MDFFQGCTKLALVQYRVELNDLCCWRLLQNSVSVQFNQSVAVYRYQCGFQIVLFMRIYCNRI